MTLLIIGIVIIILSSLIHLFKWEGITRAVVHLFIIVVAALMIEFTSEDVGYKMGQIDAMNGKYKYERHFVYPENDSIPLDTLYVKLDK